MNQFKLSAIALATLMGLTGCASSPSPLRNQATEAEAISRSQATWPEPAIEREGEMSMVLLTPLSIPPKLANKRVKLSMQPGTTVRDIVAVMAMEGVHVIVGEKEAADKEFYLPRYDGTLGDLLKVLSRSADVFFTWKENTIVVSSKERFAVAVPQESKLGEKLSEGVKALGGEAMAQPEAGLLVFEATPKVLDQIKLFVDRLTRNSALVTLEVAVLSVTLDDSSKRGVDWENLVMAVGENTTNAINGALSSAGSTTMTATTGVAGVAGAAVTAAATLPESGAQLVNGTMKLGLFSKRVSMSLLMNLLDKYGTTDTLQNIKTKTLTGHEAELSNNTQIPYIKSVGVSTTPTATVIPTTGTGTTGATGTTTTVNNTTSNSLLGSTQSATADDGVTLKLLPTYDRDANTVTIDVKLAVNSVLSFNDLSAGNQIGTLSQPTTATRKLNDILRLRPGQTAIIGGVIYENMTDNRTSLMRGSVLDSKTTARKRNEMFIVVRPTVSQFGKIVTQETQSVGQDYMPAGEDPLPSPDLPAPSKKKGKATQSVPEVVHQGLVTPGGTGVQLPMPIPGAAPTPGK